MKKKKKKAIGRRVEKHVSLAKKHLQIEGYYKNTGSKSRGAAVQSYQLLFACSCYECKISDQKQYTSN
jgi:hypothetical protein